MFLGFRECDGFSSKSFETMSQCSVDAFHMSGLTSLLTHGGVVGESFIIAMPEVTKAVEGFIALRQALTKLATSNLISGTEHP